MFEISFFQINGLIIVIPIIISVLISAIFFIMVRKSLKNKNELKDSIQEDIRILQDRLDNSPIKDDLALLKIRLDNIAGDVGKIEDIAEIKVNMDLLETNITQANDAENSKNYELLKAAINTQLDNVDKKIEKITDQKINNDLVVKDEFYELKNRVIDFLGNDDSENKILNLFDIIDSDNLKTIQWKCDILNILKEGYVPEIHSGSIKGRFSESSANKFIKKLQDKNIIVSDEIERHLITEDEYWIFDYTKNPSQLKIQFEKLKIREKEYQEFIGNNVELVETGLKVVKREYGLSTGPIDFLCMDKDGKEVGLELKYPKAQSKDVRQLDGYLKEYSNGQNYSHKIRGILVAPEISNKVEENLSKYGLYGMEVKFNQENPNNLVEPEQSEIVEPEQSEIVEPEQSEIVEPEQSEIVEEESAENYIKKIIQKEFDVKSDSSLPEEDLAQIKKRLQLRYVELRKSELPADLIINKIESEFPELSLKEIKEMLYL
jgi:phosphate/sulfate permease